MAGLAKTEDFLLANATIMIGPMTDLKILNPAAHSLGLAKSLSISVESSKTELTQGVSNDVVMSIVTGSNVVCTAEIYEFTSKNLAYGLGLDASTGYAPITTQYALSAAVAAGATTCKVATDRTTEFTAGKWAFIQEGADDYVHIVKVLSSSFAASDTTITFTGYPVPVGMSFSTGAGRIGLVNKIDADPAAGNKSFAMKVVAPAPNGGRPITILMPKVKITKGFSLAFNTENFSNLPFEFSPYVPVPTDPGYDADFAQKFTILKA